ncbi:MAG: hypothetical protein M1821_002926 [Bathelium mastoideum]|nr:MAG: hypothetical protein M1821_002926 [Bathelium mastoideum]
MLGAHRRTRSLIPVKTMDQHEKKLEIIEIEVEDDPEYQTQAPTVKDRSRQLRLVYMTITAAAAFAFGGALGLLGGLFVDRIGRRPVAITGLLAMVVLSVLTAFAQSLAICTCTSFISGALCSSTGIASLCMLGDLCRNRAERIRIVAPLPLLLAIGSIFNGFQEAIGQILEGMGWAGKLDALMAVQCVSGLFAFFVAMSAYAKMEETSPLKNISKSAEPVYHDDEKAHFLDQEDEDISPAISVVDYDQDAAVVPGPISLLQLLRAPSLVILLVSLSFLAFHSSAYSLLLTSLLLNVANPTTSCTLFSALDLSTRVVAAYLATRLLPRLLLQPHRSRPDSSTPTPLILTYRLLTLLLPVLATLTFLAAHLLPTSTPYLLADALTACLFLLPGRLLTALLSSCTALLLLAAAPDALTTGSVAGVASLAALPASTAAAAVAAAFGVAHAYSLPFLSSGLVLGLGPAGAVAVGPGAVVWAGAVLVGGVGAWVARAVREGVSVGEDLEGGRGVRWVGIWEVEGGVI